ncbi:MBL fold metallo-hydrolase [Chitinophaga arvensicola]|uniref:L-ascorbate metabolism protein UlaG, beta-lactamase superfamily n=1 Tax=Chitinophaga arvensicola TaxID=29529 RepID=A0A1I0S498_9BACT|nr:MBL fold metallo-hydrolase [Chitinophaga arvensicola]SEW49615.1 L-ascorbate metabolism protein UlaG, beta-lactamase superfamily [Chitinophaga arvensicola]
MKAAKKTRRIVYILRVLLLVLAVFIATTAIYMTHPLFGKKPSGARLERIKKSPQYRDGKFQNTHPTPQVTQNIGVALYEYFFRKSPDIKPAVAIPAIAIDWNKLPVGQPALVWLGHSSYLLHLDGKNILVDPVLSQQASPMPGGGKPFPGTNVTTAAALPQIDYLFISHDHYDHMDFETLKKLRTKVGKVICGLGVGSHLEYWGYSPEQIIEGDWWDAVDLGGGFSVVLTPARHFSGRSIWGANTLWTSYVLQTPSKKIYLGGDSGYDVHFKEIGDRFGPFDLAILENGQYDLSWKYIHMQPEEVIQATKDLDAKVLLPVHSSKFVLANHAWYEPLERISRLSISQHVPLLTPLIGEIVNLNALNTTPTFWWKKKS